ncbi:MAG: IS3 family transposase [Gammaproteobacteria bacterium]|nr:IS3 family transposase [Gammaproteobacteria bacterium]MBT4862255.1 IS3 family transposase [Gammaproteobacteria bacterium]MBT6456484.1 IS3 family transposase [Gammaproteobacteria bacterium]MBT6550720.1 IS3 family transposase [Gammaproteobacteria bacterium]MBT6701294.1 IS3 family transposase [Gammaproteobacteria bacterium]
MGQKRTYKQYSKEYKEEAVALVREQGYSVPEAAKSLGIASNILYRWKQHIEEQQQGKSLAEDEREELKRLRKEVKNLRMEKEIFKKGQCLLRERNEVKFGFIRDESSHFPVTVLCRVMRVSTSAYYVWKKRPGQLISADILHLHRRMKELFKQSRDSLGSREMMKKLRKEGIEIGRYKVRNLMKKLSLKVTQRIAYKVTTKRKYSDKVADNLLNQNFNPIAPNQVWAGDITYLKTGEGWMYLAIVMDLYSRRIVGWAISKRMTTDLICKAMIMAYNLRKPPKGLVFHSDRGSQYTSKRYRKLLDDYGVRASMGDVGTCYDNAVVERFFGSLKHDWIFKIAQPTREHMKKDVAAYMRYYNLERLHTKNGDKSPINYENSLKKVSGWT